MLRPKVIERLADRAVLGMDSVDNATGPEILSALYTMAARASLEALATSSAEDLPRLQAALRDSCTSLFMTVGTHGGVQ